MSMVWDWHNVIKLQLPHLEKPLEVIPTTRVSDLVLMHKDCDHCWTMDGIHWSPQNDKPISNGEGENEVPIAHDLKLEYQFMEKIEDRMLGGHYWKESGFCFEGQCSSDSGEANDSQAKHELVVYGVQDSYPEKFATLGDGYLGLGTSNGYDGTSDTNILEQMYAQGMIDSKVFGVHTHMYNSTEDPSTIRFGGINEQMFEEGHELLWVDTVFKGTW